MIYMEDSGKEDMKGRLACWEEQRQFTSGAPATHLRLAEVSHTASNSHSISVKQMSSPSLQINKRKFRAVKQCVQVESQTQIFLFQAIMCGRQNNGLPRVPTPYSLELLNTLVCMTKGMMVAGAFKVGDGEGSRIIQVGLMCSQGSL